MHRLLVVITVFIALSPASGHSQAVQPPAPSTPQVLPLEQAVLNAANDLFSKAALPGDASQRIVLVVDPLIDGNTGMQTIESGWIGNRIAALVNSKYPRFDLRTFTSATVQQKPVVLIGTFTPINQAGQAQALRDAYRVCLGLADLNSGKLVSKGFALAQPSGVDPTPIGFFRDSPVWTPDAATDAYIRSCQGTKSGDPIKPIYVERIQTAALLSDAIRQYDAGSYNKALDLYKEAATTPGGDQLRVYNGIYLANLKLNRMREAEAAYAKLVEYGLKNERLAIKFLYQTGKTTFLRNRQIVAPYPMWIKQIASEATRGDQCLEVVGHTSHTGTQEFNDALSLRRAESMRARLVAQTTSLQLKLSAKGLGWRENLIGTGRDDLSDAIDRRVELKVVRCVT